MSLRSYAECGYDVKDLSSLENQTFIFASELPISKLSKFGDPIWDW